VAEELSIPSRGYLEAHFTDLRVTGQLPGLAPLQGPQSARREDDGEARPLQNFQEIGHCFPIAKHFPDRSLLRGVM
jgi:hypothetical protein